jgi:hypothetical protein
MAGRIGRRRSGRRGTGSLWLRHPLSVVRPLSAVAVVLGVVLALAVPAVAAGQAKPPPRPVAPSVRPRLPLQPAFPARLWRPGPAGQGGWQRATVSATTPPVAPGSPWRVQQTPNPPVRNGFLTAASCTGSAVCAAVGSYENRSGVVVTLAEARHGAGWRIQATPSPAGAIWSRLFGVSCTAADACTAVGWYQTSTGVRTLAERWDGTSWRIQATAGPAGDPAAGFFAVSCSSPRACTAVGAATSSAGQTTTLAERWDGTAWRIQDTPNPAGSHGSELLAVSCSSPGACTAAGSYNTSTGVAKALAERWDGTSWRIQAAPSPAGASGTGLAAVSCSSARACTAAGSYNTSAGTSLMLAEAWDGTSWRIQATPSPAGAIASFFLAVSCSSPGACTAVGSYAAGARTASGTGAGKPLAERWDGTSWRVQAVPSPAGSSGAGFAAVSCTAAAACTAAGSSAAPSGFGVTLAQAWDGTGWRIQATPSPAGAAADNGLRAVSCSSARECTAVGFSSGRTGVRLTLAERWNGTRWRVQATPNPAGAGNAELESVSCASARACTAVGHYFTAGRDKALAERWDGRRWHLRAVPDPAGATEADLFGVSCPSARACTAVGNYLTRTGGTAFAAAWDGKRWSLQAITSPAGLSLLGVSCSAPRACTAAGGTVVNREGVTVAERWNGTSWHAQPTPTPAGFVASGFTAISCPTARACTAVGSYFGKTAGPLTLAEHWNGTAWRIQPTPNQPGAQRDELNQVSCTTATACTAVGDYAASDFSPFAALAQTWNGTRWRLQAIPTPDGTIGSDLNGISCTAPHPCTGVGARSGISGIGVTFAVTNAN